MTEKPRSRVGSLIRAFRTASDMTQKELCSKYNLSQGYISKIYNNFLNNIYSDLYGSEVRRI